MLLIYLGFCGVLNILEKINFSVNYGIICEKSNFWGVDNLEVIDINNQKMIGPKTEPWGRPTLDVTPTVSETAPSCITFWVW